MPLIRELIKLGSVYYLGQMMFYVLNIYQVSNSRAFMPANPVLLQFS